MSCSKRFFNKETMEITAKDLEEFVSTKVEENVNLDYTAIPPSGEIKFSELAKTISGFLNTDGGLLILGVSEDKKGVFPKAITWGPTSLKRETVQQNLVGKVRPWHDGIKINPVRGSKGVLFLIDVPRSENPPHMANFRYYSRLAYECRPMDHSQVVRLFTLNYIQKSNLVTYVYGPLYNEINRFLTRKKFREFSVVQYNQIIANHRYLLDLLDHDLRLKIKSFYDELDDLNREIRLAPTTIKEIVTPIISKRLGVSIEDRKPGIKLMIRTDFRGIGPTIERLLLEKLTPEQFIHSENPTEKIINVEYELIMPNLVSKAISDDEFNEFFGECQETIEKNNRIERIRKMEKDLVKLSNDLKQNLREILGISP